MASFSATVDPLANNWLAQQSVSKQHSAEVNYFVRSDLANTALIRHGATSARMSPLEIHAKGGSDAQSILRNAVFGQ